jgi:hypothetical protein
VLEIVPALTAAVKDAKAFALTRAFWRAASAAKSRDYTGRVKMF